MATQEFRDHNDDGYRQWLAAHPGGYVINIQRSHNPRDARLHTAVCSTISGAPARGRTFTGEWVKICAESTAELERWAIQETGSVVQRCPVC